MHENTFGRATGVHAFCIAILISTVHLAKDIFAELTVTDCTPPVSDIEKTHLLYVFPIKLFS